MSLYSGTKGIFFLRILGGMGVPPNLFTGCQLSRKASFDCHKQTFYNLLSGWVLSAEGNLFTVPLK